MSYVLEQFMWSYQQPFQISLKFFAERLFEKIDPSLKPKVFLIGILCKDLKNRHQVCLEPEDCGYSQPDFANVKELATQLEEVDAETRIFHSHPIAQENHDIRIKNNSLREAIQKIIDRDALYSNLLTYVSYPIEKEGYSIFVILQLTKSAYESHYRLTKDKFMDRYSISVSLINSIIAKFLEVSSCELYVPDAGAGLEFSKYEGVEIIKSAGNSFMYTVSSKGNSLYGLHGLFEACNIISSLKYEGEEGFGGLVIAPKDHQNIRMTLILENPIRLSDHRKTRKFLELADDKHYLISDSVLIYGIGQITGNYNPIHENLFVIKFTRHYQWEVSHAENCMMKVAYNQPFLPENKINRDKFFSDLSRTFKNIKKKAIDTLWEIVLEAVKQHRGTLILISSGAEKEAIRLSSQCFIIEPVKLDDILTRKLTSIDGAVLLSPDGICHAIGVILDGMATSKGDSARGARFNSAIRYYEATKNQYDSIMVIISEDGMVDIIPSLRPQVKRTSIAKQVEKLRLINNSGEEISIKSFNVTMDWLEQHRFYLSGEQCKEINHLRSEVDKKLDSQTKEGFIRMVRNDLAPNAEMNDTYFL